MVDSEPLLYRPFLHELRALPKAAADCVDHVMLFQAFVRHYQALHRLPRHQRRRLERRWRRKLPAIALMLALTPNALAATLDVAPQTPPAVAADGRCSLIEALENANADQRIHDDCPPGAGADVVRLPLRSEQTLGPGVSLPAITSVIRLEGRNSTIRAQRHGLPELIRVATTGDLTLVRTLISGEPLEPADSSPAGTALLRNQAGRLSLVNSSVVDAVTGAGIINDGGTLSLRWSSVSRNGTRTGTDSPLWPYDLGGIVNEGAGTAVLLGSRVVENRAAFEGGGISNAAGSSMTLINSKVARNLALYYGSGGGIFNFGTLVLIGTSLEENRANAAGALLNARDGKATLIRSTVADNGGTNRLGREVVSNFGSMWIVNSTVSGNDAQFVGGIYNQGGSLLLANSTVTDNTSTTGVAGLWTSGPVRLIRSIVSGNRARFGNAAPEIAAGAGTVIADHYNVIGHSGDAGAAGFEPGPTDIVPAVSVSSILLPLAHNGGPNRTHALAIDSPALDASPVDEHCPDVDQRRNRRPRESRCDIGAFEGSAVMCAGEVTTIVGTPADDFLRGTRGRDVIGGLSGDDRITGLEGDDIVCAGGGADRVWGGPGSDLLFGGDGDDTLHGNRDSDRLFGGAGDDHCNGGLHGVGGDLVSECESIEGVP